MDESPLTELWRQSESQRSQLNVTRGLDGNKDQAADAMAIAKNSGDSAGYIYNHYPIAERAYRSNLTSSVVNDDPMLQVYFNSHPLAPIVSKDDVHNLANYSESMNRFRDVLGKPTGMDTIRELIKWGELDPEGAFMVGYRHFLHGLPTVATAAGAGALVGGLPGLGVGLIAGISEAYLQALATQALFPEEAERLTAGEEAHPYAALAGQFVTPAPFFSVGKLGLTALKQSIPMRAMMGALMGGVETAQEQVLTGELDAKHIIAAGVGGMLFGGEPILVGKAITEQAERLGQQIRLGMFVTKALKNGETPLRYVYPQVDKEFVSDTKGSMGMYDEAFKAAKASETRELSPDLFGQFSGQFTKESISVKWDAVAKLYGDKEPTSGDGLLGDVPGIQEQFYGSALSHKDITVKWKDWVKVPDEVEKAVHDDIRLRPDLDTLNETKEPPKPGEPITGEDENQQLINETRRSMGLDPELEAPIKPGVVMPGRQQERTVKAINAINDKDVAKRRAKAKRAAERRRLPAWKKEAAELYEPTLADIENRPDFKAWKFMTNGELAGIKFDAVPKINPEALTPEQLKNFPKHWLSPNGLRPDDIAHMLGFKTGDDFVDNVTAFREMKGKEPYEQFKGRVARAEVERRMTAKYGDLDAMTTAEAREHVTGLKEEDLLWVKLQTAHQEAGVELPLNRQDLKAQAFKEFHDDKHEGQSLMRYTRELARSAKKAYDARDKGDMLGAYQARQEMFNKFALAQLAKDFERQKRADDRMLKQTSKIEPTNIDPVYADWIHRLHHEYGIPTERTEEHLAETLARPERQYKTFQEFVDSHNVQVDPSKPGDVGLPVGYDEYQTTYNPNMPIGVEVLRGMNVPIDEMSVRQYKILMDAIRVLRKLGRDQSENIITISGKDLNKFDVINQFAEGLSKSTTAKNPTHDHQMKARMIWRRMRASLWQMEYLLDRLVKFDPTSAWHKLFYGPVSEADHEMQRIHKEVSKIIRTGFKGLRDPAWMRKQVDNDTLYGEPEAMKDANGNWIMNPKGQNLIDMTNEKLVGLAGLMRRGEEGIAHAAAGFKTTTELLKLYATRVLTKDHYDAAEMLAKVFAHVQKYEDAMSMRQSGTIIEKDPPGTVWTPFGDKPTMYWPRKRDLLLSPRREELEPHPDNPYKIRLNHDWAEPLTGQIYAPRLDLDWIAGDVKRRIRYVAMRPIQDIYNKVLRTDVITSLVKKHWGDHVNDMFRDYFWDLSGTYGSSSKHEQAAAEWFNTLANNQIMNSIGFNPGTMLKHVPQSLYQSVREVGVPRFIHAAFSRFGTNKYTGEQNRQFIHEGGRIGNMDWTGAGEVKNRRRSWKEELDPAMDEAMGRISIGRKIANHMSEWGAWVLAKTDSNFSEITYLARYREVMDREAAKFENKALSPAEEMQAITDAHVEANRLASRAVRVTHGSMSISGKPALLRSQNAMMQGVSRALNFMLNAHNNRLRALGKTKDIVLGRSSGGAIRDAMTIVDTLFTYVVLPTIIEDFVDPMCGEDESALSCTGKFMTQAAFAPIPIVRDLVHAIITGNEPTFGITFGVFNYIAKAIKEGEKFEDDNVDYGRMIKYAMSIAGSVAAFPGVMTGRMAQYLYNLSTGQDRLPSDPVEAMRTIRWGTTEESKHAQERKSLVARALGL